MDRASPAAAKIEALRGLLEIEPADIDSRYSLSALLLQSGGTQDVPAAVAELDRIVHDDHFHVNAMFLLFGVLGGTEGPGASKGAGPTGADGASAPALLERLRRFEPGRNRYGVQGVHLNLLDLFLNPLGLFLRTSIPFT